MLILTGWVLIIPAIRSAMQGFYVGADERPAIVGVEDPLFQWSICKRFKSGAKCDKTKSELNSRSLAMNPANANAVAWSFAECYRDTDQRLRPWNGPNEILR
jgi:hypothetical protein